MTLGVNLDVSSEALSGELSSDSVINVDTIVSLQWAGTLNYQISGKLVVILSINYQGFAGSYLGQAMVNLVGICPPNFRGRCGIVEQFIPNISKMKGPGVGNLSVLLGVFED